MNSSALFFLNNWGKILDKGATILLIDAPISSNKSLDEKWQKNNAELILLRN